MGLIADDLVELVTAVLADLADPRRGAAPGLLLPATLAGHRVDADAHADLVFTLGLLREAGVERIGDLEVEAVLLERLAATDAARTHTFFSYRIAETAARLGGLDALDPATRDVVVAAADSTEWIPLLDQGVLPRNYAVVLTRCELARAALGLEVDRTVVDGLVARVAALFGEHPEGWLDDSHAGRGQVDMYTVDAYLFAEPFADRLGGVWDRGLASAAGLVAAVAHPNGAALPWGRSIGALAVCHSAELSALLLRRAATTGRLDTAVDGSEGGGDASGGVAMGGVPGDADRWWSRARAAADGAAGWFDGGLVAAHKRRAPFRYRGPFRRLQMTLDCLGKLVVAALDLRRAGDEPVPLPAPVAAFPAGDAWLSFGPGLGVWARRDPRLSFALPIVGGPGADYAPSPRHPGTFEVPTDQPLACFVPLAWRGENRFAPGGRAAAVAHRPGGLDVEHDGFWSTSAPLGDAPDRLEGRRRARYRVEGRSLVVDEDLEFAGRPPGALAVLIPEVAGRPLHVTAGGAVEPRLTTVDVDGMAEWRSFESELRAVHQIEVTPAPTVRWRWTVTPKLRVVSSAHHHWYHQCLYTPLADRVDARPVPYHLLDQPERLARALAGADVFHLHWPEWLTGPSARRAQRVAAAVAESGTPVVWTQHNLAPHAAPDDTELYRPWAELAAGVIHHSEWGRQMITERYEFAPGARHAVVPHGHWGPLMADRDGIDRAGAERELGLTPCALRIGLVGAPRPGKHTQLLLDGFHAARREDVQLLVLCLEGESVPDDPRITALRYAEVPRDEYDRRLATIDVLALPLDGGTYLTTGQAADAVGAGIPALTSPWPYLAETLRGLAIPYGRTAADLAATVEGLDEATLSQARAHVTERRAALDWGPAAEATWTLLDAVAADAEARRAR